MRGGPLRVRNAVIEPLVQRLGYARLEAADPVETREGSEAGGTLLLAEDDVARLPVWTLAVRAAIDQEELFGQVFMLPVGQDFEFANFTLDELAEVLSWIAQEQGAEEAVQERVRCAASGAANARDLMNHLGREVPEYRFGKGRSMGERAR